MQHETLNAIPHLHKLQ